MNSSIEFDVDLIQRYDLAGPRYTSYPTAVQFHHQFGETEYLQAISDSNTSQRPLSLYVHLPFCGTVCYYCACNKIITQKTSRAVEYLAYLKQEIALQAGLFDKKRLVTQLHLGGGTPTYLTQAQLTDLMDTLRSAFNLDET